MRILQISESLRAGGAQHVAAYLAAAFPTPCGPSLCAIQAGPFEQYLRDRGVRYNVFQHRLLDYAQKVPGVSTLKRALLCNVSPQAPAESILNEPRWHVSTSPAVQQWVRETVTRYQCDVAHVHAIACVEVIATVRPHVPVVIYSHHNILSERHGPDDIAVLKRNLRLVTTVTCPTEASREDFIHVTGFPKDRVKAIANPSFLACGTVKHGGAVRVAGTLSNLESPKGADILLKAWRLLQRRGTPPGLCIVGGSARNVRYWQGVAKELRLCPQPRFLGEITRERALNEVYRTLDLVIVPSRSESFSLVISEAFSKAIPVIASDIRALREVAADRAAFFPVGDAHALAACVERLQANSSEVARLSAGGYDRWREVFAGRHIRRAYGSLYSDAIERAGSVRSQPCV